MTIPTHITIDPCAAITDYIKEQLPTSHVSFWSKALVHGEKAVGARFIRHGFAFNPMMDLAWALGFPKMLFIVDGYPKDDSRDAIAKAFDPEDTLHKISTATWLTIIGKNTIVQPLRGAMAVIVDWEQFKDPFKMDSETFKTLTEFKEYSLEELISIARAFALESPETDVELFLEALLGPDVVVEALMNLIEEPVLDSPFTASTVAVGAVQALIPIVRRLLPDHHENVFMRLLNYYKLLTKSGEPKDASDATGYHNLKCRLEMFFACNQALLTKTIDIPAYTHVGLFSSVWDDRDPSVTQRLAQNEEDKKTAPFREIPEPRMIFAGGKAMTSFELAWESRYNIRDKRAAYLNAITTIQDEQLLPAITSLKNVTDAKKYIDAWCRARGI